MLLWGKVKNLFTQLSSRSLTFLIALLWSIFFRELVNNKTPSRVAVSNSQYSLLCLKGDFTSKKNSLLIKSPLRAAVPEQR